MVSIKSEREIKLMRTTTEQPAFWPRWMVHRI